MSDRRRSVPAIALGIAAVTVCCAAAAQDAPGISVRQADVARDGRDVGPTRIVVDGPNTVRYDRVINRDLEFWAAVSVHRLLDGPHYWNVLLSSEGTELSFPTVYGIRRFKLTMPYVDPQSSMVANQRNSPIALCNARLSALAGGERDRFLNTGVTIAVPGAYRIQAAGYYARSTGGGGGTFKSAPGLIEQRDEVEAPVTANIECRALGRPRPRTETSTAGAPPRTGQRREPSSPPPPRAPIIRDAPPPRAEPRRDAPPRANPQAAATGFDVRIRRVDRDGPNGATQLWLYNEGPDVARACVVTSRAGQGTTWETMATSDIEPRAALKLDAPLPSAADLRFRVACNDEPTARRGNNTVTLP